MRSVLVVLRSFIGLEYAQKAIQYSKSLLRLQAYLNIRFVVLAIDRI
jgi:hypothetical protein